MRPRRTVHPPRVGVGDYADGMALRGSTGTSMTIQRRRRRAKKPPRCEVCYEGCAGNGKANYARVGPLDRRVYGHPTCLAEMKKRLAKQPKPPANCQVCGERLSIGVDRGTFNGTYGHARCVYKLKLAQRTIEATA